MLAEFLYDPDRGLAVDWGDEGAPQWDRMVVTNSDGTVISERVKRLA